MRLPNQTTGSVYRVSVAVGLDHAVAPSQCAPFHPLVQRVLPLLGLLHGHSSQVKCTLKGSTAGIPCWECSDEFGLSTGLMMCLSSYPLMR